MFTGIAERYRDSTAVVIGAGGIGGEIVRSLLGSVAKLVVADQNELLLDKVHQTHLSGKILLGQLNVQDSSSVAEFFRFVKAGVGSPHFCFYTAGILTVQSFADTTPENWDRAVSTNLNGAFYCTKAVAELMIPQQRGSILLLGSIAGTKARSGSRVNPVYNTTKAGLAAFVNATAMQLRPHGLRINCISPGPTSTAMMDIQPIQVHTAVREIMLDERMNDPSEVAELALFIAAHGRFTGEDICMGGGAGLGG